MREWHAIQICLFTGAQGERNSVRYCGRDLVFRVWCYCRNRTISARGRESSLRKCRCVGHGGASIYIRRDFASISDSLRRERAEYTGGPIPEPTFAATQPVVGAAEGLAHEGHPASAVNGEKPGQTGNTAVRKKEYSHRRRGNENQPYYWSAQGYGSPWGAGNQFDRRGQFVWRY